MSCFRIKFIKQLVNGNTQTATETVYAHNASNKTEDKSQGNFTVGSRSFTYIEFPWQTQNLRYLSLKESKYCYTHWLQTQAHVHSALSLFSPALLLFFLVPLASSKDLLWWHSLQTATDRGRGS